MSEGTPAPGPPAGSGTGGFSPSSNDVLFDFRGRRVWVTGASRGIGRAIALGYAGAGAALALTARSGDALTEVAREAVDLGSPDVLALPASVADGDAVRAATGEIREKWGTLDSLVNCAGVSPTFKRADLVEDAEWRDVVDINLTGTFLCAREAAKIMSGRPAGGSIVNISSIHGQAGMERIAAYSATKGAVDALTRTLALDWASRRIRVNTVSPGYIETDMTEGLRNHGRWSQFLLDHIPMGRFGTPGEIVGLVMFLTSDAAGFVTGANFVADGGWTAA